MKTACGILLLLETGAAAFRPPPFTTCQSPSTRVAPTFVLHQNPQIVSEELIEASAVPPCFWRLPTGAWEQRINVDDLRVGQKLVGVLVQELLDAKTGPKLWFDCGVGRIEIGSGGGKWKIANGMHRIRERKESVVVKKVTRLRKKRDGIDLWVSRIYKTNGMFEVVTREEEVPTPMTTSAVMVSASALKPNQEMIGKVVRIEPYGVFVNVGANRNGLLHIRKVADLFGTYIDKEEGLTEAGLEKGAKIRVVVANNERKRLFLDFPDDVKADAEKERFERAQAKLRKSGRGRIIESDNAAVSGVLSEEEAAAWINFATGDSQSVANISSSVGADVSEEEAAAWASYAGDTDVEEGDDDDDYYDDDDEDEDRSIEDALGIGMY